MLTAHNARDSLAARGSQAPWTLANAARSITTACGGHTTLLHRRVPQSAKTLPSACPILSVDEIPTSGKKSSRFESWGYPVHCVLPQTKKILRYDSSLVSKPAITIVARTILGNPTDGCTTRIGLREAVTYQSLGIRRLTCIALRVQQSTRAERHFRCRLIGLQCSRRYSTAVVSYSRLAEGRCCTAKLSG